jgi:hypothetical protein
VSSSKDDVGLQMHVLAMIQKLNRMNIPKVWLIIIIMLNEMKIRFWIFYFYK